MKHVLLKIWNEPMSDYIVLDYLLKSTTYALMAMWVLGMGTLLYGLISGQANVANASFGIFDYI
jgi:hypothetical protein